MKKSDEKSMSIPKRIAIVIVTVVVCSIIGYFAGIYIGNSSQDTRVTPIENTTPEQ